MSRIPTSYRTGMLLLLTSALILVPLTSSPAAADPNCRKVHGRLFLEAEAVPTCGSPVGLCATATIRGSLKAVGSFVGTSILPTADTPATGVVVVTGDNSYQTDGGQFFTKDAIVLSTVGDGDFAEVDVVVGGTGQWTGATGTLTATGTFANGAGEGFIEGQICVP